MSRIMRFDHVTVTVQDLDRVTAFFVGLGLEIEGRTFLRRLRSLILASGTHEAARDLGDVDTG